MNYQDIFSIFAVVSVAGTICLGIAFWRLKIKWKKMFGNSASREALIADIINQHAEFKKTIDNHNVRLKITEAMAMRSIHKIGFLRFNPFIETGGDNSFALTLLDRDNNGVIISSLYTRDNVRVYCKAIAKGEPLNPLSKEEIASLKQAMGN